MTLTKQNIINKISEQANLPQGRARKVTEAALKLLKDTLASGEDVMISGLGRFEVKQKRVRKGRNPQTRSELLLRARKVITFKVSGVLRDRMNEG